MKKERFNKWQINYVVTYQNKFFADVYRKQVLEILHGIALVRGIECAKSFDIRFYDESDLREHTELIDEVSDLVYFRSSVKTKIRPAAFRKVIDLVFEEQRFLGLGDYPFEVCAQLQKYLNLYPFPKD